MGDLNNQNDLDAFLMTLMATPQYGDSSLQNGLGSTLAKKVNQWQDIEQLLGIPLTQLAGGNMSPDVTAVKPSYNRQVYGNDPMYAHAFDLLDSGAPPTAALNELVKNAKQYGVDPNAADFKDWKDQTFKVLTDYGFENAKNAYEAQSAGAGGVPGADTYTLSNGKKFHGSPDVFGFKSEFDLMGAPTADSVVEQYAASKGKSVQGANRSTGPMAPVTTAPKLSKVEGIWAKKLAEGRLAGSKSNMVRSDANADLTRRILFMRNMLGS
jgi:hypothetical protein